MAYGHISDVRQRGHKLYSGKQHHRKFRTWKERHDEEIRQQQERTKQYEQAKLASVIAKNTKASRWQRLKEKIKTFVSTKAFVAAAGKR